MIYILLRIPCWNGPVLESRSSKEIIVRGRPLILARSEPISCFRLVFWQWLWDTLYIRVTCPYYLLFQTHNSLLNRSETSLSARLFVGRSVGRSVGWLVCHNFLKRAGSSISHAILYNHYVKKYNVQYV